MPLRADDVRITTGAEEPDGALVPQKPRGASRQGPSAAGTEPDGSTDESTLA